MAEFQVRILYLNWGKRDADQGREGTGMKGTTNMSIQPRKAGRMTRSILEGICQLLILVLSLFLLNVQIMVTVNELVEDITKNPELYGIEESLDTARVEPGTDGSEDDKQKELDLTVAEILDEIAASGNEQAGNVIEEAIAGKNVMEDAITSKNATEDVIAGKNEGEALAETISDSWNEEGEESLELHLMDTIARDVYLNSIVSGFLFLLLSGSQIFKALRVRHESRADYIRRHIYAALFLICAAVFFIVKLNYTTITLAGSVYAGTLLADRVISIWRNHRLTSLIFNILFILGVIMLMFDGNNRVIVLLTIIAVHAFVRIIVIAFSRLRVDVLRKIIRKTFAPEILLGLLLLIAAVAFSLHMWEPGFENLGDCFWYCFALVTTIGFGDVTATTVIGRILSVILGIYGIIVVGLVTSIIINFYTETKSEPEVAEEEEEE